MAGRPDPAAARVSGLAPGPAIRRALRKVAGLLDDAVMLLLLTWLFPAAILVVGTSVALLVRLLIEIANRL